MKGLSIFGEDIDKKLLEDRRSIEDPMKKDPKQHHRLPYASFLGAFDWT